MDKPMSEGFLYNGHHSLMRKELVKLFDETVKRVHVGFFPPNGRYFRKEMISKGNGCFTLDAFLPKGTSFFHYFFNRDFETPKNNGQDIISMHDPQKRAALVMETPVFCPVEFKDDSSFISHVKGNIWEFRAITHHGWVHCVDLVLPSSVNPMTIAYRYKNCTFWIVRLALDLTEINFSIKISGAQQTKYLHKDFTLKDQVAEEGYFYFSLEKNRNNEDPSLSFRSGYQIFPDRFQRTDPGPLNPGPCIEKSASASLKVWGEPPDLQGFYGGNIKGMIDKLGYIAGLGVDFIYLNPVFLSKSAHRYDCIDYLIIDPLLGSNEDFKQFLDKAHALKIKVILDISLNHCSTGHFAFRDLLVNQEESVFRNWFEVNSFPVSLENASSYSCWHGYRDLPQFNLSDKEVEAYFLHVARFWSENYRIDGWRLDVCAEMPAGFIKKFIEESRNNNPEMAIVAEAWQNEMPDLLPDCERTGITNYAFYLNAVLPFFERESLSVSQLAGEIMRIDAKCSFRNKLYSWNFLSNHDIPRFYSILRNKKNIYPAYVLLFVLPGIPIIYYGEESLMEGLSDPENRGCMNFDSRQGGGGNILYLFFKELNGIREKYAEILSYGNLFFPFTDDDKKLLLIGRSFQEKNLYVLFNFDDKPHQCAVFPGIREHAGKNILIKENSFKILHDTSSDF